MSKVGIFGGSFNPVHLGHINSVVNVKEKLNLNKVFVVPAYQNPHKEPIEGPTPEQRLKMAEMGFNDYGEFVEVDSAEIERKGDSYTIETIKQFCDEYESEELHLIIGIDTFYEFDKWKDFDEIIKYTNIIVTSRPGNQMPFALSDMPKGLQPYIEAFDRTFVQLSTGRYIEMLRINDIDISASDLRKKIRNGMRVEKFLTYEVESFIKENELYKPLGDRISDYRELTDFCARNLMDKMSISVRAFDLKDIDYASEYTVIASGSSTRQTISLAENIMIKVKEEYGILPQSVEGTREGRWCLIDYGALIVHVFYDHVRMEYQMENLWQDGEEIRYNSENNKEV